MHLLTTAIPYLIPKMLPCVQAVFRCTVATRPCLWDIGWGCCAIPPGHCCFSHFTWNVQDPGGWWEARKPLQNFHHHLSPEPIKSCSPLVFLYYCVCLVLWVCLPKVKLMYLVEMESMFDKHSFVSLNTQKIHSCLFIPNCTRNFVIQKSYVLSISIAAPNWFSTSIFIKYA